MYYNYIFFNDSHKPTIYSEPHVTDVITEEKKQSD